MKRFAAGLSAALSVVGISHAAFPDKPIRFVVAFAPGSSTDIVARLIGEQLSVSLGQPVIIENKPGAGGNSATQGVMNGPADGYTLLFHRELGFKDLEANTWFAVFAPHKTPTVVLDFLNSEINKALGAKSLQERFETLSLKAIRMDRPTLRRYVESEVGKWGRLVKALQIQVQRTFFFKKRESNAFCKLSRRCDSGLGCFGGRIWRC